MGGRRSGREGEWEAGRVRGRRSGREGEWEAGEVGGRQSERKGTAVRMKLLNPLSSAVCQGRKERERESVCVCVCVCVTNLGLFPPLCSRRGSSFGWRLTSSHI